MGEEFTASVRGGANLALRGIWVAIGVVLYGCEGSSLTLREERRLRLFENRILRRIF